jgi:hypothetical protein
LAAIRDDRDHWKIIVQCDQCPWTPVAARDITKSRGKLFVSIEACPVEYDLTAIVDGRLRLGDRHIASMIESAVAPSA